jgi:trans-2,3-dihydro-3-hydroxyanthranilate isomerase
LLIVPLDSLETIRAIRANLFALAQMCERVGALGFCAFTTETVDPEAHVHCRIFAPGAGVGEDPATGSANGPLGAYLAGYGLVRSDAIVSEQGFEMRRPSRLHISIGRGADGAIDDVRVAGGVYIVGEGRFFPW